MIPLSGDERARLIEYVQDTLDEQLLSRDQLIDFRRLVVGIRNEMPGRLWTTWVVAILALATTRWLLAQRERA